MVTMRWHSPASSGLWVMSTMVFPCSRCSRWNRSITRRPVAESSAPVGSSASKDGGVVGHGARNGHALLLPAGQLVRALFPVFIDPGHLHGLVHTRPHFRRGDTQIFQRKSDVLLHYGGDDLVIRVLEHHAHLLADVEQLVLVRSGHILHVYCARLRQQDGVKMLGQRGFAAPVRPQHGHIFAALYAQRKAVHSAVLIVRIAECDIVCSEHFFHAFPSVSDPLSRGPLPRGPSSQTTAFPCFSIHVLCPRHYSPAFRASHHAVAPQGTTPPVAVTGRPISSQAVCPPHLGHTRARSIYSITLGERPVV